MEDELCCNCEINDICKPRAELLELKRRWGHTDEKGINITIRDFNIIPMITKCKYFMPTPPVADVGEDV